MSDHANIGTIVGTMLQQNVTNSTIEMHPTDDVTVKVEISVLSVKNGLDETEYHKPRGDYGDD